MHWQIDEAANAASLILSLAPVVESEEVRSDVVFDFDAEGRIARIEVLNASALLPRQVLNPAIAAE